MAAIMSRTKVVRLVAVLILGLLVALPISSAYLNPDIIMSEYAIEKSCYCHNPLPDTDVDIVIDVPLEVAYTPSNDSVAVEIGILGQPEDLTGFGVFLNGSETSDGVRWTRQFSNDTLEIADGEVAGIIRVNDTDLTTLWTVGEVTHPWFNLSFIPGLTDQDIVLSVAGMRADGSGNESGDLWNAGEVTITVRKQRLVNLTVGVTNLETVSMQSVVVDFYMDNEYIGNSTTSELPAGGTENATFQWDATYEKDGKHIMRAVIDPEGLITETDKSNNEVTRDIWLGGPPEETDLSLYYNLGGFAVAVVIVVAVLFLWRRRQYRF